MPRTAPSASASTACALPAASAAPFLRGRLGLTAAAIATALLLGEATSARAQAVTAAPAVATAATPVDADETRALHALFERQWEYVAREFPEWGVFRGDLRYADRLTDMSSEAQAARDAMTERVLTEARAIRRDRLAPVDQVSLDVFVHNLERQIEQQAFTGWRTMSLRALGGPHSQLPELLAATPMRSPERVEQALARMAAYPLRIEQEIASLRRGMAAGWVPPREVLERVLASIDGQLTTEVERSPHYAPFTRLPATLGEATRAALQARARTAVQTEVQPALRQLRSFITDEYLPRAPASGALAAYPDGPRVYEMLVQQNTTTTLSAAEIHAIGQRELTRLRAEMDAVRRELRFDGDFAAFAHHLNTAPEHFHTSAEALLAGYREIAKRIDAEMPRLFAELPRAPYGIVAMPAHRGNSAEYYQGPALDGSRAGFFFANVTALDSRPKWAMETLTAHEGAPGHHTQIARSVELQGLPHFRRSGFGYTAYSEGWALYAETLGFELGLYTDPLQRWGHLQWQAFRAARLVVDTGIHAQGWSRQQAIDFMAERTGVNRAFVESEIDRYISQPGQALAYMIGKLKFDELRDRGRAELGARFDIRRFHNAVLDHGALPLSTLERVVDAWIAAEKARTGG
jgi:uncharacterized protein (DUF885 family)